MNNDSIVLDALIPDEATSFKLYSDEALLFLKTALAKLEATHTEETANSRFATSTENDDDDDDDNDDKAGQVFKYAYSTSEDEAGLKDEEGLSSSTQSGSDAEDSDTEEIQNTNNSNDNNNVQSKEDAELEAAIEEVLQKAQQQPKKKSKPRKGGPSKKDDQRKAFKVKHYCEVINRLSFPVDNDETTKSTIQVPSSLLGKVERGPHESLYKKCQSIFNVCQQLSSDGKPVIVLMLRSGRFAGGVFQKAKCIVHRSYQRYTIRKKQGKAQSTQDSSKKANSMGSQIRRAEEKNLREDIATTIQEWKPHFQNASLILISCPKTMRTALFGPSVESFVTKDDKRIRSIPFDTGRPTFASVCIAYDVMMDVIVGPEHNDTTITTTIPFPATGTESSMSLPIVQEEKPKTSKSTNALPEIKPKKEEVIIPLTPLHEAARDGDMSTILSILTQTESSGIDDINRHAGPDFMTPLHYAAAASGVNNDNSNNDNDQNDDDENNGSGPDVTAYASCISLLLIQGLADPSTVDARSRLPYFLASHDLIREAFRKARATLGEDHCDWQASKVGPPLTDDDIASKKEKEAEKRRKKKARQKANKAKEKEKAQEMENRRLQEEQKKQQEIEAKRIRDGLQPKTNKADNVCDFCQTVCKGKKRNQMFHRLEYAYCSSECVQKHKRELMAAAAMARMGK